MVAVPVVYACAGANTQPPLVPPPPVVGELDDAAVDAAEAERIDAGAPEASAPAPDVKPDVTPPAVEELQYACGLLLSCGSLALPPNVVPADFGECVRKLGNDLSSATAISYSLSIRECALAASSCSKLSACLLHGVKPTVCKGRATGATGDDKVAGLCDVSGKAVTCYRERVLLVRDCPRGGEECAVRQGDASCTFGACTNEAATPHCTPSQTRVVRCDQGKLVGRDCSLFGLTCAETPKGAACTTSATCEGTSRRCENGVAVVCHDGHEVRVDCEAAGLDCEAKPTRALISSVEKVGECFSRQVNDPCDGATKTSCDGSTITSCVRGKKTTFACKAINLSRCEHSATGVRCAQ